MDFRCHCVWMLQDSSKPLVGPYWKKCPKMKHSKIIRKRAANFLRFQLNLIIFNKFVNPSWVIIFPAKWGLLLAVDSTLPNNAVRVKIKKFPILYRIIFLLLSCSASLEDNFVNYWKPISFLMPLVESLKYPDRK